ncbi:hypothetical protein WA1_49340 [Scytonema hofmannii PCC 7110]|uniref:Uncharacterized protein n=1 Tax=Scytonema hofmannii PCC 7110 TaxID=128403 RepID=A0A139WQN7_9CYAN|nr:hypothetical protein [Scytonema hofmannii]KYC34744.1 hypothetical protein WA1_49340 [Scytonema hofmannii PCC 7110]
MQSQLEQAIQTGEPTILVPTHVERNIPLWSWGTETETILAIAILIRSCALLIQALAPLIKKQA